MFLFLSSKGMIMQKKALDVGFVVLHYNAIKETQNCVASLQKNIDTPSYFIAVVDNASPNGQGDALCVLYKDKEKIAVIKSKQNLGFAKGNNLGIDYIREHFNAFFVCTLNNDTILQEKHFFSKLKAQYTKQKYAILAPRLIEKNTLPPRKPLTQAQCKKDIEKLEKTLQELSKAPPPTVSCRKSFKQKLKAFVPLRCFVHYIKSILHTFSKNIKLLPSRTKARFCDIQDMVMAEACTVFSPLFFEKYSGFFPDTFMYSEGHLLTYMCKKARLHEIYKPNISVKHLGRVAIKSQQSSDTQRTIQKCKWLIQSRKVLLKYIEDNNL